MIMPVHINFATWANGLIVDFPTDPIPDFVEGHDWHLWGNAVAECPTFESQGVPGTMGFKEPLEWAMAVYREMSNFA